MRLNELKVGMTKDIAPVTVDEDEMLSFSRRFNNIPIHTDKDYCKNTKFEKPIASGIMSFLVVWAEYIPYDFAGDDLIAGKSSHIDWFKPVFAGDILKGSAKITNLQPRNEYNGVLEITIDVYNQNDELVLRNITECIVQK